MIPSHQHKLLESKDKNLPRLIWILRNFKMSLKIWSSKWMNSKSLVIWFSDHFMEDSYIKKEQNKESLSLWVINH